ncbi:MAG TPA: anti-sigma regulatory factor [Rhodocyclaceae bacterium]|nr:anti-sigma regulatory factor [Rhodocyclaceae bacterium]
MTNEDSRLYVRAEPDVAAAMRLVRKTAEAAGFGAVESCYLATVATELASNLWIHAGGGVFRVCMETEPPRLEITTTDNGPGIPDVDLALQEGFSTAGGLGCGLPGVQRIMDGLEIVCDAGGGTSVRTWKLKTNDPR